MVSFRYDVPIKILHRTEDTKTKAFNFEFQIAKYIKAHNRNPTCVSYKQTSRNILIPE